MKKFFIFLTIFACLGTFKVQAQDTENSNIEEIIVTSLKRANGIAAQDLPVSVTAISPLTKPSITPLLESQLQYRFPMSAGYI